MSKSGFRFSLWQVQRKRNAGHQGYMYGQRDSSCGLYACIPNPQIIMKGLISWALFVAITCAQNITTDFATYFNVTTFPKEQWGKVSTLLGQGLEIAGSDIYPRFMHRCIRVQIYGDIEIAPNGFITPISAFKNIFFVGQSAWSSWAIDTGNRELLLIDTLASPKEAEQIILPGLEKFGYKGSDIKTILITHEHTDHFGGLAYLQKRFNPVVYASETAWKAMAKSQFDPPLYANYSSARNIDDGKTLRINDFNITTYLTPGHTPGTVSLVFPAVDNATQETHTVGFYGGGGIPRAASAMAQQIQSWTRWSKLAIEKNIDVLMSNHQSQDNSIYNFDLLNHRDCQGGKCNMPNPFVIGADAYSRYAKAMAVCVGVQAARNGIILDLDAVQKRDADVTAEECHD